MILETEETETPTNIGVTDDPSVNVVNPLVPLEIPKAYAMVIIDGGCVIEQSGLCLI